MKELWWRESRCYLECPVYKREVTRYGILGNVGLDWPMRGRNRCAAVIYFAVTAIKGKKAERKEREALARHKDQQDRRARR